MQRIDQTQTEHMQHTTSKYVLHHSEGQRLESIVNKCEMCKLSLIDKLYLHSWTIVLEFKADAALVSRITLI